MTSFSDRLLQPRNALRSAPGYAFTCTLALLLSSCGSETAANRGREDLSWFDSAPLPWHTFDASGPVRFSATVSWDSSEQQPLSAFLSIHNPSDSVVKVRTGPCGFGLRAYTIAPPMENPVWDDRPPAPTHPNTAYACPDLGLEFTVPPGGTERIPVHNFGLGALASLPNAGRYVFAVLLQDRDGVVYLVPSDTVDIPDAMDAPQ
jgi:hypothetical protein